MLLKIDFITKNYKLNQSLLNWIVKCLTKYQQLCDTCVDSNGRIGRTPARVQARARVVIIRAGHGAVFSIQVTITGTGYDH